MYKRILKFLIGFFSIFILFILLIIVLFFVYDTIKGWKDPCYNRKGLEEVGKGHYGFLPEKGLVCQQYICGRHSFCYKKIEGADYETFKGIGGGYYMDKNDVYYHGYNFLKIENADLRTFTFLDYIDYDNYAKDLNNCYRDNEIIKMSKCDEIERKIKNEK